MLQDPFLKELHKKFLPMRLRRMRLKIWIERMENKKKTMILIMQNHKKAQFIPNVKGMSGMDAVALLGNLGLKVK